MSNQYQKYTFIQRIMHLLHFLQKHQVEFDQVTEDDPLFAHLDDTSRHDLHNVMESIRFMDAIPGGYFIFYAQGDEEIIYANRGVLKIFQCDTIKEFRELTGNSFRGMVHPEDLDQVERSIHQQVSEHIDESGYVEFRIRRKDGTIRWVDGYGHFDHIEPFGDIHYAFIGDSSDERSRQQEEQMAQRRILTEALAKADLAVQAKNLFLSNISHEMRTPLNAVFGFTSLAKSSVHIPGILSEYLERIEIASRQLLDMITKVLDLSTLSDAASPAQESCNLQELLQEAHDAMLPEAEKKSITCTVSCSQTIHRNVYTDVRRLKQMIHNLTDNAVKYTKPDGKVDISLSEHSMQPDGIAIYRLEVADTGIGMDEEFLAVAFEPFSRERLSTISGVRGMGLGLAIVKSIVDSLGGTIDVRSDANQGSVFTVTLPLLVQHQADCPRRMSKNACSKMRILMAEDNEINSEIQAELLEQAGFIVDCAVNGKEAVDLLERSVPGFYDLVILDLHMPVMDGWQAATAIRGLPDPALSSIPLIALSANVETSDRQQSLACGIDVHLPKPMDLDMMLMAIEHITQRK